MVFEKRNGFSLMSALRHTLQGMKALWQHEKAFRIEVICSLVLIPFMLILQLPAWLKMMLVMLLLFLLLVEAMNSAIEAVIDRISLEIHDQSRLAKDMSSAAVGIAVLMNIMAWGYAIYLSI